MIRIHLDSAPQFRCENREKMMEKSNEIFYQLHSFITFLARQTDFYDNHNGKKLIIEISVNKDNMVSFDFYSKEDGDVIRSYLRDIRDFKFSCVNAMYLKNEFKSHVPLFERRLTYGLSTNNLNWANEDVSIPVIDNDTEFGGDEPYKVPFCEKLVFQNGQLPPRYWNTLLLIMPLCKKNFGEYSITFEVSKVDYGYCYTHGWIKPMAFSSVISDQLVCSDILKGKNTYFIESFLNTSLKNQNEILRLRELINNALLSDLDASRFVDVIDPVQKGKKKECADFPSYAEGLCKMYSEDELIFLMMSPYTFNDSFQNIKTEVIKDFRIPTIDSSEISISDKSIIEKGKVALGVIGKNYRLSIDPLLITQHMFVTGTTGSGKTTYINNLLESISKDTKCLVIDPVKDEYLEFWNDLVKKGKRNKPRIIRAEMNGNGVIEKFNLFVIPSGIQLNMHIALLDKVFCSLVSSDNQSIYSYIQGMIFTTYKEVLKRQVVEKGLLDFSNKEGKAKFRQIWNRCLLQRDFYRLLITKYSFQVPTIDDFVNYGINWIKKICSPIKSKVKDEKRPSRRARNAEDVLDYFNRWVDRLRDSYPCFYQMFGLKDPKQYYSYIDDIDKSDILIFMNALRDVSEKKAIFMYFVGVLDEYRRGKTVNSKQLKHLTILEEAHTIAKSNPDTEAEKKTNEMISDMLAEIRAFGEGIIIAEQSPQKLIMDVITNTSIKIIKRIGNGADIEYIKMATGLSDEEAKGLSFLSRNEAIAYVSGLSCPVLLNNEFTKKG